MGAIVSDPAVPQIQNLLNSRFAPGEPLSEMIAIQKEFVIFDLRHSLRSITKLLNIPPHEGPQRRGWFKFCEHLRDVPSDEKGMNAHDRVIAAIKEDLESKKPLPIYFNWHPGTKLQVTRTQALVFSKTEYLMISAPVGHA